jgi:predicted nucleic acid-binding protein
MAVFLKYDITLVTNNLAAYEDIPDLNLYPAKLVGYSPAEGN